MEVDENGYIRRSITEEFDRVDSRLERVESEQRAMKEVLHSRLTEMNLTLVKQRSASAGWGAAMGTVFSIAVNWVFNLFRGH